MDYKSQICLLVAYIEQNIKGTLDYQGMERTLSFSYRYIREMFKNTMGISLSRYISARKVANAAFEMRHSSRSITDIALDYNFENPETLTRAFFRDTGLTPSGFRKSGHTCGRRIICPGVYAPVIIDLNPRFTLPKLMEVNEMAEMKKTVDSCVLYGVPEISWGREIDGVKQNFPFPMCLQSVLNYMGQNISFVELVAYTGEAFRQRWEEVGWSPATIDPRYIYKRPLEAYERGFKGAGRKFNISVDSVDVKAIVKEDAIALIKSELDCGRPVIALGVVGPPEACIITGYRNNGETVLGWSLFQNSEWSNGCTTDESGYFCKSNWWVDTQGIMTIGEEIESPASDFEVLENALSLLNTQQFDAYNGTWPVYGGQKAYEAWAEALEAENFDLNGANMGQGSNERMATEGRGYAADYMNLMSERYPAHSAVFAECEKLFRSTAASIHAVTRLREKHGMEDAAIRKKMAAHIRQAAQQDDKACAVLNDFITKGENLS